MIVMVARQAAAAAGGLSRAAAVGVVLEVVLEVVLSRRP